MICIRKAILTLILCLASIATFSQSASTQGKEFWLSYMQNGYYENTGASLSGMIPQLTISAKRTCSVTVTNPNFPLWSMSFFVQANGITQQELPVEYCYHMGGDNESIQNKGLHIVATDTVSVYCANIANYSFDASFVLPIDGLGDRYIVQCGDQSRLTNVNQQYQLDNQTSAFLIVATEDNTTIHIMPTATTLGGHPAGTPFEITLNAGQTYHVRSNNNSAERDLSGSQVIAEDCKKIAVFNGNTITRLPVEYNSSSNTGFDHIFEQAMPTRSWGKRFVVTQSLSRNRDFVKIVSAANGNQITKNGMPLTTLDAYQSYVFEISSLEGSCYLEATQPSAVYLYNTSAIDDRYNGDPSMVWIAPIEQRIDETTFATFSHIQANIPNHYVNVIVKTDDINSVTLDGIALSPLEFNRVNGNPEYSYARKSINHGTHHLSCPRGFNAHVYGFGDARGYAYLVGSNAIDLSTNLSLNDLEVQANDVYPYCVEEPITFSAEVNYQDYQILWDFGDGTTGTTNPAFHTYHDRRVYHASLIVTTDESGCEASAHDTTAFIIDATQQYVIEDDYACEGGYYTGHGFNNILIVNDTILGRLQDNPIHPVCKDSLLVYIHAWPSYHMPINDSRCWTGEPGVYDGHGFSFEYDHAGTYDRQLYLQTIHGCDSVLNLHLDVTDRITTEFSHTECDGVFIWDGRTYDESGDYEWPYVSLGGCDSIVTLHLTMGEHKTHEFSVTACGNYVWDDAEYTVSGTYEKYFETSLGCDSIVTLHLTINDISESSFSIDNICNEYLWIDTLLTQNGTHTKIFTSANGCDSIVHLHLDLNYSPNPTDIAPLDEANTAPHWVVTASEFQVNSYDYTIEDMNPDCRWDTVYWEIENDVTWVIEPFDDNGKSCKLYVLNRVEDTVWLTARVVNECNDTVGEKRRYWLICSFYGIEEDGPSTDSETFDFNVVPNPNNGEMYLNFEQLPGDISLKVYDMRGVLIDEQHYFNPNDKCTQSYSLPIHSRGLYLFVVTTKKGSTSKKVIKL